jgi:glycosyltransferase involved in cell wall biosynthesis
MRLMISCSHPTGNANVREVLRALGEAERLGDFYTCLGTTNHEGGISARGLLSRRTFPVSPGQLRLHPWREALRLVATRFHLQLLTRHESGFASVDAVYRGLDRHVARSLSRYHCGLTGVYCYEDGALETFRVAGELGINRFYDLPIAYWNTAVRLLREEAERLPEWEPTLSGNRDSTLKHERKTEELKAADVVVCPSSFVFDSLPEDIRATKRCEIAHFGSPCVDPAVAPRQPGPLRVLFAGSMTQRKGLADVFEAFRMLRRPDIELVVMGSPVVAMQFYRTRGVDFTYEPPRTHRAVLELMRGCDVFVLPSIVEGRALVQQEALSCGLPLIVTHNAGGDDLITEGGTGVLVPIRSPERIAEAISWFAENRDGLPEMRLACQEVAAQKNWADYRRRIQVITASNE